MPTNILLAGGAGFIGSNMILLLKQIGYTPIVLDNFSSGSREAVAGIEVIEGDIADTKLLAEIFTKYHFNAVMYYATCSESAESPPNPGVFYHNNVVMLLNLLDVMRQHKVKNILFASSADVFGQPDAERTHEKVRYAPMTTYGRSLKMAEEILQDYGAADVINYAIMRTFEVAGAEPSGRAGDRRSPAKRFIMQLLEVAAGQRSAYHIQGEDYKTGDGTIIRDYLHISDLCSAHLLALKALLKGKVNKSFNLGSGRGYSIKQVISSALRATKRAIPVKSDKVLPILPPSVIADPEFARQELGWQQRYQELDAIILHAWQFMQKKPQ
jgi:UDP-glucose 4-epimerase